MPLIDTRVPLIGVSCLAQLELTGLTVDAGHSRNSSNDRHRVVQIDGSVCASANGHVSHNARPVDAVGHPRLAVSTDRHVGLFTPHDNI
jgi:hypothetical protein